MSLLNGNSKDPQKSAEKRESVGTQYMRAKNALIDRSVVNESATPAEGVAKNGGHELIEPQNPHERRNGKRMDSLVKLQDTVLSKI